MPKFTHLLVMTAALGLMGSAAEARRTAIDSNPDGSVNPTFLSGYCDLDGLDCTPIDLGYSVDFGDGRGPVSSVIVYGNGLLSFGATPIDLSTQRAFAADNNINGTVPSLSSFGSPVVSAGLDELYGLNYPSNDPAYELVGSVSIGAGGVITATYKQCFATSFCDIPDEAMTLTPVAGGFQVRVDDAREAFGVQSVGYSIGGTTLSLSGADGRTASFFIPATIDIAASVPEPASWAMMVGGIGLLGAAARRCSRRSVGDSAARA